MKLPLILIATFLTLNSFAQDTLVTYYAKKKKVSSKDSAEFIRLVIDLKNGEKIYPFKEYYVNDVLKREGKTSNKKQLILEGLVKSYYPNTTLKSEINYLKNFKSGINKFYYPNGSLKKIIKNTIYQDTITKRSRNEELIISFLDSVGNVVVSNGNGYFKDFNDESELWEEGEVLNGMKEGRWVGNSKNFSFEEEYKDGMLLKGISLENDLKYPYTAFEQLPEYPGGMTKFYEYVGRTYRYSREALEAGISGRVILSFVIEKDGSIVDIKVLRDLGLGTGEEAVNVLKKCSKWIPGKDRGRPVSVSYTIPIVLNLQTQPSRNVIFIR